MSWIAFTDQMPPEDFRPALLVTNNLEARNAAGTMTHLWLVRFVHVDNNGPGGTRRVHAYADSLSEVNNLTHWRYALPEEAP